MAETGVSVLKSMIGDHVGRSVAALMIKVATAGLTYAGFVVLARSMPADEYGYFALGLSVATVLAILAGAGQSTAIVRFWPEETARNRPERAVIALRAGGAISVIGSVAVAAALVLVALAVAVLVPQAGPVSYLFGAAALILPMVLAEYNSAALRAQGSVWIALSPRDLIWRITLPLGVAGLFIAGVVMQGWSALLFSALLLFGALGLQYLWAPRRGYALVPGLEGLGGYWRERKGVAGWLLFGSVVNSAALNADTIVVGSLLDAQSAGAYFNAMRTAALMTLFSFSISLVIAPVVSRHFHGGAPGRAQIVLATSAWAGFLFSLCGLAVFVLFGPGIMRLFGETYESATPLLIVLGLGFLIDAATGPSRTVLMMTGHERSYALIFAIMTMLVILSQIAVIPLYGAMGVAVTGAAFRSITYLVLSIMCVSKSGLDPTIFGAIAGLRYLRAGSTDAGTRRETGSK